jgi:hypothetical protein
MRTSENLDAWSCGGWGVFISLNHQEAVREVYWRWAHRTVRCATGQVLFTVRCAVTSPNRYGLELGRSLEALSSCGTEQSGAPPDRSCSLSGAALTLCALFLYQQLLQLTVARVSRYSAGTPDSPVNYSGVRLKGKCALGPFLSILVIWCPTQVPKCKMVNKVQIKDKGMFLRLSTLF